ncbi:MAG: hypothetical protein FWE61_00445 [Micrococcales bacterium]|nr:hypothetical protein [Micrococcales bacterium]
MAERPAVVFDTDVFVNAVVGPPTDWPHLSALSPSANPDADCLSIAFDGAGLRLMVSRYILSSISGTLRHLGVGAANTKTTISAVLDVVKASGGAVLDPPRHVFDLPDHHCNLLMDLAVAVHATLVVTDDADLNSLNAWQGIPILRLRPLHRPEAKHLR